MSVSISLDDEIVEAARLAAQAECRSVSQQIEHWARLGRKLAETEPRPKDAFVTGPSFLDERERRQALFDALSEIASKGTFAGIDDPVAWQREQRRDRPLPGRES